MIFNTDEEDWRRTDRDSSSVRQQLEVFAEVDVGKHLHYHIHASTVCGLLEQTKHPIQCFCNTYSAVKKKKTFLTLQTRLLLLFFLPHLGVSDHQTNFYIWQIQPEQIKVFQLLFNLLRGKKYKPTWHYMKILFFFSLNYELTLIKHLFESLYWPTYCLTCKNGNIT